MNIVFRRFSLVALVVLAMVTLSVPPALAVVIYSNDFTGTKGGPVASGWSAASGTPLITEAPISPNQQFLGTDADNGISNNTMTLSLSGLSGYTSATVEFDLYIIRSWDGNNTSLDGNTPRGPDRWQLVIGGATYVDTTFSNVTQYSGYNQAYPGTYPGGDNPPQTNAIAIDSLKYPDYFGTNSTYHFSFTVPLSGDLLSIAFIGLPTQAISDESWGIDNVRVSAVPILPSVLLLGSGLLGLGALGWRRKRD